ncbi:MAG: hypothetical protein PSX36_10605 [bacterium]|nr:hypothetical protein [bacterium]
MTAIIGYTNRTAMSAIGVLCADDLEGNSQTKVDKLSKIAGRFVVATTGLQVVDSIICSFIGYFDQFSGSQMSISSIEEFERILNEVLKYAFIKIKKSPHFEDHKHHLENQTQIVVLDILNNKLYQAELGKVWRIEENPNYEIKFVSLEDKLYSFGVVTKGSDNVSEQYNETNKETIIMKLTEMMIGYKTSFPKQVGNMGAIEVCELGENPSESFRSCFSSWLDSVNSFVNKKK